MADVYHSPSFQFYPADFLSDTMQLSVTEIGAYVLLLFHAWERGSVPSDVNRIAQITRLPNRQAKATWEALKGYFEANPDGSPSFIQARLERTRSEALAFYESRVENGRKGGLAKSSKRLAPLEPSHDLATSEPLAKPLAKSASPVSVLQSSNLPTASGPTGKAEKKVPPADLAAYLILDAVYPLVAERFPDLGMTRDVWRKSNKAAASDLAAQGKTPERVAEVLKIAYGPKAQYYGKIVQLARLAQSWAALVGSQKAAPSKIPVVSLNAQGDLEYQA